MPAYGMPNPGGNYGPGGMVRRGGYVLGSLGQPAMGAMPTPIAGGYSALGDAQNSAIGQQLQFINGGLPTSSVGSAIGSAGVMTPLAGQKLRPFRGPLKFGDPGYNPYNPGANYSSLGPMQGPSRRGGLGDLYAQRTGLPGMQEAMQLIAKLKAQAQNPPVSGIVRSFGAIPQ